MSNPRERSSDADAARRLDRAAGLASVGVASTLVLLKAWALAATGALSIGAALADSALDLLASTAGLLGIVYAAKPPDEEHSFGHSSIEDLVALGQALLVTGSAVLIGWHAVARLRAPEPLAAERAGLAVMAISIALTLGLVLFQSRVAGRTGSRIVAADRMHYLADLLPNLGAIVALGASAALGARWPDPVIALAACIALVWGARRIGLDAWHALMDRRADPELVARVERLVAAHPGVRGHHDLRTRTAGARVFIQVHVELDGSMTLNEAHAIAARLKSELLAAIPRADVIIHQDPV
jgi:ferrous-iron efflux pump FieF